MTDSARPQQSQGDPMPKPDRIDPVAPPEEPVQPTPQEDPAERPLEVPGNPGGDDIDQPGRGPDEVPPQRQA